MSRKFTFTTQVYDERTDFPATGDVDVIYIDASKNTAYRYDVDYYAISSAEVDIWGAMGSLSKGGGGGGGASWGSISGTLSNQTDLQSALDSKQDDLVSGTNIKTVNSTSVLGSGDIAVQPTLVSGTNIKTINGSSVLGSGDLTISGGGGGFAVPIPQVSTIGYMNSIYNTSSTAQTIVNNMYLFPFIPMNDVNTTSILIQVSTAQPASTGKMVIYSSNAQGLPSTLLVESTALDCSTTGFKNFISSQRYTANTKYWIGFVGSVSNISTTSNSLSPVIGVRTNSNAVYNCLLFFITYPTIPTTLSPGAANFNNQGGGCPRIIFLQ